MSGELFHFGKTSIARVWPISCDGAPAAVVERQYRHLSSARNQSGVFRFQSKDRSESVFLEELSLTFEDRRIVTKMQPNITGMASQVLSTGARQSPRPH